MVPFQSSRNGRMFLQMSKKIEILHSGIQAGSMLVIFNHLQVIHLCCTNIQCTICFMVQLGEAGFKKLIKGICLHLVAHLEITVFLQIPQLERRTSLNWIHSVLDYYGVLAVYNCRGICANKIILKLFGKIGIFSPRTTENILYNYSFCHKRE